NKKQLFFDVYVKKPRFILNSHKSLYKSNYLTKTSRYTRKFKMKPWMLLHMFKNKLFAQQTKNLIYKNTGFGLTNNITILDKFRQKNFKKLQNLVHLLLGKHVNKTYFLNLHTKKAQKTYFSMLSEMKQKYLSRISKRAQIFYSQINQKLKIKHKKINRNKQFRRHFVKFLQKFNKMQLYKKNHKVITKNKKLTIKKNNKLKK